MGGATEMHHLATDNSLDLRKAAPEIWSADRVNDLEIATLAEIDRHRKLLDDRQLTGQVRHCHGDLHLRNICLIDGRPTLFDAIEFDDKIACIDVLYDLAFLLMDLEAQNLRPFANVVVNEYLAETGDWRGVKLLPLFMSVRAAIRAKVSEAAAAYEHSEEAKKLHEQARHFFELAETFLQHKSGQIIAMSGLSGSGKSTIAATVAPNLGASPGAIVIKSDVLRKQKYAVPQDATLSQSSYTTAVSREIYHQLTELTLELAASGFSVIADAAFLQEWERSALEQNAIAFNIDFTGLWIDVSPAVQDQRLRDRVGDVSDATVEVGQIQRNYDLGDLSWVHLDGDQSIKEVANTALTLLIPEFQ
jgi:predicted kinase